MEDGSVTVSCDTGNEYNGRLGIRISSIFVIGFGSFLGVYLRRSVLTEPAKAHTIPGALLPIVAARTKRMRVPPIAFFITKYFGSGVIIATAFIHVSPLLPIFPS